MGRHTGLLLIAFLFFFQAEAQRLMILQKGTNQKTTLTYEAGDLIRDQQTCTDFFVSDRIKEIHPDFLVMTEDILQPEEIEVVDVKEKADRNRTLANLSVLTSSGGDLL